MTDPKTMGRRATGQRRSRPVSKTPPSTTRPSRKVGSHFPAVARGNLDVLVERRIVRDLSGLCVPNQFLPGADRDDAKQDHFGEWNGILEVRAGYRSRLRNRIEPLAHRPAHHARNGRSGPVLFELLHDGSAEQPRAVGAANRREERVLLAEHEHPAFRQTRFLRVIFPTLRNWRLLAIALEPFQNDGRTVAARGKVISHFRSLRRNLVVHLADLRLNGTWRA